MIPSPNRFLTAWLLPITITALIVILSLNSEFPQFTVVLEPPPPAFTPVVLEPPPPAVAPIDCHWVNMRYQWRVLAPPVMCIRGADDALSGVIHREGKWPDCDDLVTMLPPASESSIFVDVGANIGACTIWVAGHGHVTHSFEAQGENLQYLYSTLSRLPELRVHVHPVAVGEANSESIIYRQEGNAGNSVVGVVHPDDPTNQADRERMERNAMPVHIRTMDSELWPDPNSPPPNIALMKMDIQGYEVKALKGASRLLAARAIKAIKTELAPVFLAAQNSSQQELCSLLAASGFSLRNGLNRPPISTAHCAVTPGDLYAMLQ